MVGRASTCMNFNFNKMKGILPNAIHSFQNRTGPGGRTMKTVNRDENRFFKHKKPDFLLIP